MPEDCDKTPPKILENPFTTPGAISWSDLASKDPAASKAFYAAAFGWEFEEMEKPMGTYSCIKVDGARIGGIMQTPCPKGTTTWTSYVTVEDADATFAKVKELAAIPVTDVMIVPTVGKMFLFQDPQGAIINAIQYIND
jgi:predicted enzyme related to lactoylglutathione lyase|tara:strand:- start:2147 stop:2563 length:417 start_codon:yes stop_codon:yes gene_type:complete